MKVMQIIPNFCLAGAETMCKTLSLELRKMGIDVVVISLYSIETVLTKELTKANVKIYYLNKKSGVDISLVKKLRNIIAQEKPNIIHTHLYSLKYAFFANIGLETPIVHTVHNIANKEVSKLDRILCKFLFKKRIAIPVALSKEISRSICTEYDLSADNVPIVLNGVDLSRCYIKSDYSISKPLRLINIARFNEQKNQIGLIKAFSKFLDNNTQQASLLLVGDGPLIEDCKSLVVSLGIEKYVTFYGLSDNVYPLLLESDIFILPSNYEGVPITIVEAMATGLPIIASNVGGIPDMITHLECGYLCLPTTEGIIEGIECVLTSEEFRRKIGTNALKRAIDIFSSQTMAHNYLLIYRDNCR